MGTARPQQALSKCEASSDAEECQAAARSNLPPTKLSEAYTYWADTFPNQWGNTTEPMKLLRKAIQLDPIFAPSRNRCMEITHRPAKIRRAQFESCYGTETGGA